MMARRTTRGDLAGRMRVKPQEVTRIVNVHHATKIDSLADAFATLGRRLELSLA